jgi:hypothetical protein
MTTLAGPVPVLASVLSLRMRGFGGNATQQASRREQLLATARKAFAAWESRRGVVLEAPDGLAFVGDIPPSVALQAAAIAAQDAPRSALGIGLHHGPVHLVTGDDGTRVTGEGLEMAAALAGFGNAHGVVTSQSFREALSAGAPRQARELRAAGELVDEQMRKHPVFVFDADAASRRAVRRNVLMAGGLLLVLGAGWAGRVAREQYEAARRPAILHLDIKPSGEIFVDGELKGTTPPLADISLPAGPHTVEVRSGRFPPLRLEVELHPGEELQLKHVFAAPPPPPRRRAAPAQPAREPTPLEKLERAVERYKFW